jgi:hypothetical protein
MIGTAMMIAVIGQHEPDIQLDSLPWEVDRLDNRSLRVFGLTLEKTSIQQANQLFASFGKTQLRVVTDNDMQQTYELIALYDDLTIGGLIAQIILRYDIKQQELQKLYQLLNSENSEPGTQLFSISNKAEMNYLSTAISAITYIPSIDYGLDAIRQNFGQATEEKQLNEELLLWIYPELGLTIHIHSNTPDEFVYALQTQPQ